MPKNIVVFSDGTGQEGGEGPATNVYKLFNLIENRTARQVSFYDRGLGTGWRKLTGNAAGAGISKNILECYEFIFEHYAAGDQIFLFGFSRGATTVRTLSSFIHMFGILPKSRPELIKRAYRIYRMRSHDERRRMKRLRHAEEFVRRHHTMWTRIRFLGAWDTVAALGIPFKAVDVIIDKVPFFRHRFHNLSLSESVDHARHALAIDDERLTFHPTLWDRELPRQGQTLKQVWFCGMHTDVGGGYREHGLSDIPLIWMVQEAAQQGLLLFDDLDEMVDPDPDDTMHDSRDKGAAKLYRRRTRSWDAATHGRPVVHESVLRRTRNRHNLVEPRYAPWILAEEHDVEPWPSPGGD